MLFGHNIAKQLETKITDPVLQSFVDSGALPLYPFREHRIQVTIHDVPLLGFIDSFDPDTHAFRDQKTSHRTPKGEHAWNQARVDALAQLPFYSALIEAKHGGLSPVCYLDYMETDWKKSITTFDGHDLDGKSDELFLTGHLETFERTISPMDRYRELEDTVQCAWEISADFIQYKKNL